jgi:hypothetical protein
MAIEKILYPAQKAATLPKLKNGGNVVPIPPNPGAPDWYDEDYYKKRTASPSTDGILAAMSESDLRRFYGGWLYQDSNGTFFEGGPASLPKADELFIGPSLPRPARFPKETELS